MSELVLQELACVREELSHLRERSTLTLVELLDTRAVCDRYGCDERTARRLMRSTGCAFHEAGRLRVHAESLLEHERNLIREQNAQAATVDIAGSSRRVARSGGDDGLGAGWWRP